MVDDCQAAVSVRARSSGIVGILQWCLPEFASRRLYAGFGGLDASPSRIGFQSTIEARAGAGAEPDAAYGPLDASHQRSVASIRNCRGLDPRGDAHGKRGPNP